MGNLPECEELPVKPLCFIWLKSCLHYGGSYIVITTRHERSYNAPTVVCFRLVAPGQMNMLPPPDMPHCESGGHAFKGQTIYPPHYSWDNVSFHLCIYLRLRERGCQSLLSSWLGPVLTISGLVITEKTIECCCVHSSSKNRVSTSKILVPQERRYACISPNRREYPLPLDKNKLHLTVFIYSNEYVRLIAAMIIYVNLAKLM